ncbi:9533_t:CDS:1 [Paraglomus brasilianum]|uniref:9533_t:CDS:1 n=1 Tax=Paraglomus brasilianum TaxID=144538 RepID=A0A9N9AY65_9GLOM|nr:9533_t:CDS:1 [Paraglomus brasilianum]
MKTITEYGSAEYKPLNNDLDRLAPEIKVEIILHLSNPISLAQCSRAWHTMINLPVTKSKWLISRYGKTHALFHAVRMGRPFINVDVVECLFAQNAHISRYFVQRLMLGFGKYDNRLIDLKLAHNMTIKPLDPNRKRSIQRKIQNPWASNLPFDVFSRILKEGHDQFDGDDTPVRGNDMESFYYLSAGPLVISQARTRLRKNKKEIKTLIQRYKFAPFPPRPKIRKRTIVSHPANYDDYPPTDGYENVRQQNVIARAILLYPKLVNVWKKNEYYEIVDDINDLVMGSILLLSNFNPTLGYFIKKLETLQSVGFRPTDEMMGDALIFFEHRLKDIEVLIDTFVIGRGLNRNTILSICLRELLNPGRNLKRHDLLDYILDQIDDPEETTYKALRSYNIANPVKIYLSRKGSIPLALTLLKYAPIVYQFMLVKFGVDSPVSIYLVGEITTARIGKAKLHKYNKTLASSTASIEHGWQELNNIFNVYYMEGVPIEPRFLPLFETCPEKIVIKCLFKTYLPKLFELGVKFQPSRVDKMPVLEVTPFTRRRRRTSHETKTEWLDEIRSCNRNDKMTATFRHQLEKFRQRIHSNRAFGTLSTSSKRHRHG